MSGIVSSAMSAVKGVETSLIAIGATLLIGTGIGMGLEYKLMKPKPAVIQVPQVAERQGDGSVILATQPSSNPQPKQEVPKGYRVERVVEVKVLPGETPRTDGSSPKDAKPTTQAPSIPQTPVIVDLTLVKDGKGNERVIASSPNGTIQGDSIDIPAAAPVLKETKWGIGPSASVSFVSRQALLGIAATREMGPFRIGLNANKEQASVWVLIKF